MHKICKVAVVQHPPVFLNLQASIERAGELIKQAASEGAKVIAFPETWLPGYPIWLDEAPKAALWDHAPAKALYQTLVENSIVLPSPQFDSLLAAARQADAYVIMGAHERDGGTLYNTTIYIEPDGRYQIHRKLMPTYTERLVWGQGDGSTLNVMNTDFGVISGLICWEHWMPLARAAMHAKGETIHIAQWPTARELHQIASRHYAFEGQCFVLAAGTVLTRGDVINGFKSLAHKNDVALEMLESIRGDEKTFLQYGGSAIIAPDTSYIVEPVFEQLCILYAELDLDLITQGHLVMDTDGHYARPDVFHLEVNQKSRSNVRFSVE